MKFWLMKSEPDSFSIDDLAALNRPEPWDGIRNYQARNFMRDEFNVGDLAFFYHSSCKQPGVVGIMRVVSNSYPDPTQFDSKSPYHDAKSDPEQPRWLLLDMAFERKLKRTITLQEIKACDDLRSMQLLKRGNRLSIMPVEPAHWDRILELECKQC